MTVRTAAATGTLRAASCVALATLHAAAAPHVAPPQSDTANTVSVGNFGRPRAHLKEDS